MVGGVLIGGPRRWRRSKRLVERILRLAVELGLDRAELAGDGADLSNPAVMVSEFRADPIALHGGRGMAEMASADRLRLADLTSESAVKNAPSAHRKLRCPHRG